MRIWKAVLIVAVTFVAYFPALRAGYIWDDDDYVYENPTLENFSGLAEIWTKPSATPQYYPLVHTTYWIEHRLWGLEPMGYHATNIALHASNAVLIGIALETLGFAAGGWWGAAWFALHPVGVESTAWVTERKNTLSLFFYLLAFIAFFRFGGVEEKAGSKGWYAASLVCFALAMFSKTVTCSLPAALALVIFGMRGKIGSRDWLRLAPMFVIGLTLAALTVYLEKHQVGASGKEFDLSFTERLRIAGRAPWFYFGKLLAPVNLSFIYPRWEISPRDWGYFVALVIAVVALAGSVRAIGRAPILIVCFYIGTLFPALGFIDVFPFRYSFVADHFQYHAMIGGAVVISAIAGKLTPRWKLPTYIGLVGYLILLGALTFRQARVYKDEETLWLDTIDKNPGAIIAYTNLGSTYGDRGEYGPAAIVFQRGLTHAPDDVDLMTNLAGAWIQIGRHNDAVDLLRKADLIDPDNPWTLVNMGLALSRAGKYEEAIFASRRALARKPDLIEAYSTIAAAHAEQGELDQAIDAIDEGLHHAPDHPILRENRRRLLDMKSQSD